MLMLLHCVGASLALLFDCTIIKADLIYCELLQLHTLAFFDTLKIFNCLATLLRIILNRVNFGVRLLRMVDLFFKILNLSIFSVKLS